VKQATRRKADDVIHRNRQCTTGAQALATVYDFRFSEVAQAIRNRLAVPGESKEQGWLGRVVLAFVTKDTSDTPRHDAPTLKSHGGVL
jgi:hypothetical protein